MRIYGPNGTTLGSPASNTRRAGSSGFSLPDDVATAAETRATTVPKAAAGIDALIALQGIEEDPTERHHAWIARQQHAANQLDRLLAAGDAGRA